MKKCKTSHGAEGEGNQKMPEMLNATIKPLGSPEVQKLSDAQLKKAIVDGVGKMQPVKGLTDEDVANVLAYTRTIKAK